MPVPSQEVAVAAYGDEAHVDKNRELYVSKFDLADQIIGNRYGYRRPPGGFFLWLDVKARGGSEAAALRLWREAGLRVLPGRYIAREAYHALRADLADLHTASPPPRHAVAITCGAGFIGRNRRKT